MRSEGDGHVHDLAGAYSVDALDEVEQARFERHLAGCAACSREVREFTETASRLGAAAAARPPEGLRQRVLANVRATRQASPRHGTGGRLISMRRAAAAAVAAAALSAGLTAVLLPDGTAPESEGSEIAAVLTAPDSVAMPLEAEDGGRGTWHTSVDEDAGVVVATGLPTAPDGWTYQVWLTQDDEIQSAGLLPGDGILAVHGAHRGAKVALTLEHEGGASSPTGPMVLHSRGA